MHCTPIENDPFALVNNRDFALLPAPARTPVEASSASVLGVTALMAQAHSALTPTSATVAAAVAVTNARTRNVKTAWADTSE